jgi:DNA helicase-2/ATP-dependent DNA helicase PcrA
MILITFFYGPRLPFSVNNAQEVLKDSIWIGMLNKPTPQLPFKMIMRLSELIINANPIIKQYLHKTYQYVFLDEFQDTTIIQYDFLTTCFFQSSVKLTAVGDDKQRIMMWAGAKETAFDDLKNDIGALEVPLFMNFRSAPRLVALQNYLVQNLLKKNEISTATPQWSPQDGECDVWIFENPNFEKERLFNSLKKWIEIDQVNPRDICILVKQQLRIYAGDLIDHLNSKGIRARDESELQNLLTEDLVLYFLNMLYYVFGEKQSLKYQFVFELLKSFHGYETDSDLICLEIRINQFKSSTIDQFNLKEITKDLVDQTIENLLNFAGIDNIKAKFERYSDQGYCDYVTGNFAKLLFQELKKAPSMFDALDSISGKDTIPVMTVHKSKGLEYHTVIFVGLEDNAFWTYQTQPDEDRCTFFVALSRAKNRVVFTFSKIRYDKFNRERSQNIEKIGDILDGLDSSGLVTISDN